MPSKRAGLYHLPVVHGSGMAIMIFIKHRYFRQASGPTVDLSEHMVPRMAKASGRLPCDSRRRRSMRAMRKIGRGLLYSVAVLALGTGAPGPTIAEEPLVSIVADRAPAAPAIHGLEKMMAALRAGSIACEKVTALETARGNTLVVVAPILDRTGSPNRPDSSCKWKGRVAARPAFRSCRAPR